MSYRVFGGFRFYESGSEGCEAYLGSFFLEDDPAFERVINFPPVESVLRLWRKSAVSLKMSNYLYSLLFHSCLNSAEFLRKHVRLLSNFPLRLPLSKRYAVLKI